MQIILRLLLNPVFLFGSALFFGGWYFYNKLVKARLRVEESLSEVNVLLDRIQHTGADGNKEVMEATLQHARKQYNEAVNAYNYLVESFPSSLVALMLGLKREEFALMQQDEDIAT